MAGKWNFSSENAQIQIKRILLAIANEPLTVDEIADSVHMSDKNVRTYLTYLHKEKRIFVKKWKRIEREKHSGFDYVRAWLAGYGRNATRPKPLTTRERSARYLKKVQADPFKHAAKCAKLRQSRKGRIVDPYTSLHWNGKKAA